MAAIIGRASGDNRAMAPHSRPTVMQRAWKTPGEGMQNPGLILDFKL